MTLFTIVDTTVLVDFYNDTRTPQTEWMDQHLETIRFGITDLTLCEVLQGFRSDVRYEQVKDSLLRFEVFSAVGPNNAIAAAARFRILRRKGITVRKTIDCLIANFCIQEGHLLLHSDRDFDPFEAHFGLEVVHPR